MCGIFGYVGEKGRAVGELLEGLKRLEYRGYDSAGVAFKDATSGATRLIKRKGRIAGLEEKLPLEAVSPLAIFHTRWATHGVPSDKNAHPHADCAGRIFVAHNGIVENYREIKEKLFKKGHTFLSETDTEVVSHLIEELMGGKNSLSFEAAVDRALTMIKGSYAFLILDGETQKLVAARNSSPLLVGVGKGEYFVGSDPSPMLPLTRDVVYLSDGEYAVLNAKGYQIFSTHRKKVSKEVHTIEWDAEAASKSGFPHFMLKEIFEEPDAIENAIRGRLIPSEGLSRLGGLEQVANKLRNVKRIVIAACGTAYYAALVGEYMLEEYAGIPVEVEYASELRYRKAVFDEGTVFIAVSQSGETADTLAALAEAKRKGLLTLGIVNVVGSTIARETDAGVYNHAGPEVAVASTKAFVSQISVLALLALFLGRRREMSLVTGKRIAQELSAIPAKMRETLKRSDEIKKLAKKYARFEDFLYVGRKYNFPIALEGALKLKEISYIHAEGYAAGEMKHGPIALIEKEFPTVAIAPSDSVYEKVCSNIEETKARGGKVIAIATAGDKKIASLADDVIYIPKTLEMLTPLLSVIPLHLFAYHIAVARGRDVDRPRNLAKSVTVE
jgi:glucosamine--fructose-6-phosphate aminotransferase (isomerizing)